MPGDRSIEEQVVDACAGFDVDWAHARQVVRLSDRLFRETRHLHGLTKTARPILQAAALLHDLTLSQGKEQHHLTGAHLVLRLPIPAITPMDKRIIAEVIKLHPQKIGVDSLFDSLAKSRRRYELEVAARIAAIFRIADGLDHSRTQTTGIAAVRDDGRSIEILTTGGTTVLQDTDFAATKTDFWNALSLRPVRLRQVEAAASVPPALPGPEDTVVEAVRRILQQQLEQLMSLEYGLPYDGDPEYVHEMRVAIRRLRTALAILRGALGDDGEHLRTEFTWFARALGKVRDSDVFLVFLRGCLEGSDPLHQSGLRNLIASERRRRRAAYRELLETLRSDRYAAFRNRLYPMVQSPVSSPEGLQPTDRNTSRPLWKEARSALKRRQRRLLKFGKRLEAFSGEELHRLRIAGKKFRYSAEFFAGVFPSGLQKPIRVIAAMQDLLGEAHDADVWTERLRQTGRRKSRRKRSGTDGDELRPLIRKLQSRKRDRLAEADRVWRKFSKNKNQRKLVQELASPSRAHPDPGRVFV